MTCADASSILDGVLTQTAKVHGTAWKDRSFLASRGIEFGFGFVVGVDRVGQADALKEHGADIVVADLAELIEHR